MNMLSRADIEKYFNGEKAAGRVFMMMGAGSIAAAALFFIALKLDFYKGAAIPLLIVGILFLTVGLTIYKHSDADRIRNVYALDMNPAELKEKELPRMQKVMRNFSILFIIEVILFLTGIVLYLVFIRDFKNDFWRGLGLSLSIMALIALAADMAAAKRGKIYLSALIQKFK